MRGRRSTMSRRWMACWPTPRRDHASTPPCWGCSRALAVSLALVGIYGVVAWAATQRTREIGIRIALGAQRADVLRLMLGQSAVFIVLGVVVGLLGSAAMTRYLEGLLFGLTPLDARTLVSVSIGLAGIAALASYLPARRAARADPLTAIRHE